MRNEYVGEAVFAEENSKPRNKRQESGCNSLEGESCLIEPDLPFPHGPHFNSYQLEVIYICVVKLTAFQVTSIEWNASVYAHLCGCR